MAASELTAQVITKDSNGLTPSYAAANVDGNYFANDGRMFLHVKNVNGATRTLTFATPLTVGGVAVENPTAVIPLTTGDKMIGPFDPTVFNDSSGRVQITYSAVTDVTVAAVRLPAT